MGRIANTISALTLALSFGLGGCDETKTSPLYLAETYSTPKLEDDPCPKTAWVQEGWWYYSKHFVSTHIDKTGRKMCDYK